MQFLGETCQARQRLLDVGRNVVAGATPPRHQAKTYAKLRQLTEQAFQKAGYPVIPAPRPVAFWHETGSAVMGLDENTSVVDPTGAVHGISGLYVADASVLPTAGEDRWIAMACFHEAEWEALVAQPGLEPLRDDARFQTLARLA